MDEGVKLYKFSKELLEDMAKGPDGQTLTALTLIQGPGKVPTGEDLAGVNLGGTNRGTPFEALTDLTLSSVHLDGGSARRFAESPRFPKLRSLRLHSNRLGAAELEWLLANRALVELCISNNPLGSDGMAIIGKWPHVAQLERLEVTWCEVGAKGLKAFAAGGPYPALTCLDLKHNERMKSGVAALGASENFPVLRELDLRDTGADAKGVAEIAAGALAQTLERLCIAQNRKVGDEGAQAVAGSDHFRSLARLDVFNTEMTTAGYGGLVNRFGDVVRGESEASLKRNDAKKARIRAAMERKAQQTATPVPAESLEFADDNLQLLVLEELQLRKRIPRFVKDEFYATELGEDYDDSADYNYEVDARVLEHLLAIPITKDLAAGVEQLCWEAGNALFSAVWPRWDGECDTFSVRDLGGIEQLVNLRTFRSLYGHEVKDWSALKQLAKLETIELRGGAVADLSQFRGAPALQEIRLGKAPRNLESVELLRADGVRVIWPGMPQPPD